MYRTIKSQQITFFDFNQSCGMELSTEDEWYRLGSRLNWCAVEKEYAQNFKSAKGHPAFSVRMALGALIIQKRLGCSDRNLVKQISENPYFQYFIGLPSFSAKCPFESSSLVHFRKRLGKDVLIKFNEVFLKDAAATPEHHAAKNSQPDEHGNSGSLILDATVSPSNIRYPQDFSLLNEAREKTDSMIDILHEQFKEKLRPRTYRRVLHKAYLRMAKSKKRPAKAMRALIRKLLCALTRNLKFVDAYLEKGGELPPKKLAELETLKKLYEQQKEMFEQHSHRVDDRIVSISQPYIRPVVRGKAKAPVEFGAKYDVSLDEKGHARLEELTFSPYNECGILPIAIARYKERTGHYPIRVLVDDIYKTKDNREYCEKLHIRMCGRGPGRPAKKSVEEKKQELKDHTDRIEVERFFSRDKRTCGAALIVTKLEATTLASIALSVLVANLFGIPIGNFFIIFLTDSPEFTSKYHFIEFSDTDE